MDRTARDALAGAIRRWLDGDAQVPDVLAERRGRSGDNALERLVEELACVEWSQAAPGTQLHRELRRLLGRAMIFLRTDIPSLAGLDECPGAWPFRSREQIRAAAASVAVGADMDVDEICREVDRESRDRAAGLLRAYLGGSLTRRQLLRDWPVPRRHLSYNFRDPAAREIHRRLLTLLPSGALRAREPLRPVVARCLGFLQTDEPHAGPPWVAESGLILLLSAPLVVAGAGGAVMLAGVTFGPHAAGGISFWAHVVATMATMLALCILAARLSLTWYRWRVRRALLTGRLSHWPLPCPGSGGSGRPPSPSPSARGARATKPPLPTAIAAYVGATTCLVLLSASLIAVGLSDWAFLVLGGVGVLALLPADVGVPGASQSWLLLSMALVYFHVLLLPLFQFLRSRSMPWLAIQFFALLAHLILGAFTAYSFAMMD